jgi:hypothetical protein
MKLRHARGASFAHNSTSRKHTNQEQVIKQLSEKPRQEKQ